MSGGHVIKEEPEKDVFERLQALEQKIPHYLERINAYDKLFSAFENLSDKVRDIKSEQVNHKKEIASACLANTDNFIQQNMQFTKLHNDLTEHSELSKNSIQMQKELKSALQEINKDLEECKVKIESNNQQQTSKVNLYDFSKLKEYINQIENNLHANFIQISARANELQNDLKIKTGDLKNALATFQAGHDEEIAKIKNAFFDKNKDLCKVCDSLTQQLLQFKSDVEKRLSQFGDIVSKPSNIEDFKNEILRKLELIALDGGNAVIRSQNADQKIILLEKKIENIFLLLKKYELSQ